AQVEGTTPDPGLILVSTPTSLPCVQLAHQPPGRRCRVCGCCRPVARRPLSQLEDVRERERGPLLRVLRVGLAYLARVAGKKLVFHRRLHEDGPKQPVSPWLATAPVPHGRNGHGHASHPILATLRKEYEEIPAEAV
ncbi:hypothetical protein, partial [Actinomadura sp.]|uniref:hypothetical protein n=1 Tax=Actinomadura sp. TaxID=1989 RepID=UPI0037CBF322